MEDKIKEVLEREVNPLLASHFGGAQLTAYEDGVVYIKLTGSCGTCPSAQFTVEDVIKSTLMEELPEVKDVVLDTSVSDELMDMAHRILNHEI